MAMNLHELEEIEYEASRGDRLWSADPTDCCGGAHQLGVCYKAEAEIAELQAQEDWDAMTPAERSAIVVARMLQDAERQAREAAELAKGDVF